MNDIKVGSSEMGNIYLGTNQLSKSGSTVDVNKDAFRYNYSMYCFINTTNQDKTIYIYFMMPLLKMLLYQRILRKFLILKTKVKVGFL